MAASTGSVPAPVPFVHPLGITMVGARLALTVRNSIPFLPIHSAPEWRRIKDQAATYRVFLTGFYL